MKRTFESYEQNDILASALVIMRLKSDECIAFDGRNHLQSLQTKANSILSSCAPRPHLVIDFDCMVCFWFVISLQPRCPPTQISSLITKTDSQGQSPGASSRLGEVVARGRGLLGQWKGFTPSISKLRKHNTTLTSAKCITVVYLEADNDIRFEPEGSIRQSDE